jgi:membrane protease YdiL (CAAX protease family)
VFGGMERESYLLVATLLLMKAIGIVVNLRYRGRMRQLIGADPKLRRRFYGRVIFNAWLSGAFVPLITLTNPDISAADVGWSWPNGDGIDYVFLLYLVLLMGSSAIGLRRRARRGRPLRRPNAAWRPNTPSERRLAVAVAVTAGITEEAVYRGVLIAVGVRLFHLPLAVAALASLALFAAAHIYQGWRVLPGITIVGGLLTATYLVSGSLLLPVIAHVGWDLIAFLWLPRYYGEPEPVPAITAPPDGPGTSGTPPG